MNPVPFQTDPRRRWPVFPSPYRNELAESWLVRLFWQLGIEPTPWRLAHRMPDLTPPWRHPLSAFEPAQIVEISSRTGLAPEQIRAMGLDQEMPLPPPGSALPDLVADPDLVMMAAPRFLRIREGSAAFILSERRVSFAGLHGRRINFCPHCLAEDDEPYLRRHWRLAFGSTCLRHGLVLADRCGQCAAPCRPWALPLRRILSGSQHPSIIRCWSCDFDLRLTRVEYADRVVYQLEQRIWLTWLSAAIDRANLHHLAEWTSLYAAVTINRVTGGRATHPLAARSLSELTPAQRHHVYQTRAEAIAGYTFFHFEERWRRSAAHVQMPLRTGWLASQSRAARQPDKKSTLRSSRTRLPRPAPAAAAAVPPQPELVGLVADAMVGTRHRLRTKSGQRAFLRHLMHIAGETQPDCR